MSQENVDQFRKGIEAFNRMDIPELLRFFDPEIQFDHRLSQLQGSYVGREGIQGFFVDAAEHFDAWRIECPDLRDLGDQVLALGTTRMTGKGSGAQTELPFTVVATFKDARITHYTDYGDRDRALEAAGLSE